MSCWMGYGRLHWYHPFMKPENFYCFLCLLINLSWERTGALIFKAQAVDFLQQIHSFSYITTCFLERCPRHRQDVRDNGWTTLQSELWPRLIISQPKPRDLLLVWNYLPAPSHWRWGEILLAEMRWEQEKWTLTTAARYAYVWQVLVQEVWRNKFYL